MRKQMTASAGALINDAKKWDSFDWKLAQREVRRLQMRIAKAVQENKWNRVKSLQYMLTNSFYAKMLAVKRVTSNKGKKTPGVDGVLWKGSRVKWQAACSLHRRGYRPQPLRRIYIEKKNGKKRPLSIPTMYDRAMQALHKLALAPVAETTADRNSYGFREGRSCADAVTAGFNALSKPNSAPWVLEADIKGCYDNINPQWMMNNIPMDKQILGKWLKAGYVDEGRLYPSRKGVPQGGIISPMLANMALDGLEQVVKRSVPANRTRVNFVRYADDFIVTAKSKRILEEKVQPAVEAFLADRGLTLSEEKTVITHITDGFTFLGQTFRKGGNSLRITPAEDGVQSLIQKVGTLIRKYVSSPMPILIKKLNQTLRGWANYHRHIVASEAFSRIDTYVFEQLWRMLRRRHQNKSKGWLIRNYWSASGCKHAFAIRAKTKKGDKVYSVLRTSSIGIERYNKIKADANPYLPEYGWYFYDRRSNKDATVLKSLNPREHRAKFGAR